MTTKIERRIAALVAQIRVDGSAPTTPTPPPLHCDTCGGAGYIRYNVPVGHEKFGKLDLCPAPDCPAAAPVRARRNEKLLQSAGLPGMYRAMTFQTWLDLSPAVRAGKELAGAAAWLFCERRAVNFRLALCEAAAVVNANGYSDETKNWIVFQGGLGLGKTGLAACIVNELAACGVPSLYMRLQEMFSEVQSRYSVQNDGHSADDVVNAIKRAPVLILDEFNVPNVSSDKARLVEEIIRYRHARQIPTVLTCNVTPSEFAQMWGERTADVTLESSHWIVLGGQKLRQIGAPVRSF